MDCLIGDGEKVFVVLLSAVVDHGGMNGKKTAMVAERRGGSKHTNCTCQNSYSKHPDFLKVRISCHFHRTLILDDPSVRGITPM
jgi:hypothetical protein